MRSQINRLTQGRFALRKSCMKHFLLILLLACGLSDLARSSSTTLLKSGQWSAATNWSPASVPQSTDDVSIHSQRFVTVSTGVGSVRTVTLGNASGEGALNVDGPSAALEVLNGPGPSILVGGPGIAGTQVNPFPSYYSHVDGSLRTSGDVVIGTNALSGEAFFNKGTLGVGGVLMVGAQEAGLSHFKVRGGGSGVSSLGANRLEVGARGQLIFDFLGGATLLPITVTNQVSLAIGSALVVANMANAPANTYTLIEGGSLSGTFSSVEIPGLPFTRTAQIVYDQEAGDVLLVVSDTITEFDNYTGDRLWRNPDNWFPTYPDSAATGRLIADAVVDAAVEIGYLESGTASLNSALNLFPGGFLQVNEPGVSMVIGVLANGPGAPNYYTHAAGTLITAGDLVLGANGGKAAAQFSSGTSQVGGALRIGSYQNAGSSFLRMVGGGGTMSANHLEVGANGQLIFDFIGGVSLKTLNVTNSITLLPGAKLSITNTSGNPSPLVATTYTLLQGASLSGSFSQVEISGYPASLNPRIVYSSTAVRLVVEPIDSNVPSVDGGTSRLGGYSRVVPSGAAGWSFGTAADGEEIYYSDYDAGTITKVESAVRTSVLSNAQGIYGLALKGDKMYFGREFLRGGAIFEMTRSGTVWGAPRQVLDGIIRPRQLYVESSGDLLVVVETGQILRINPVTGTSTTVVTGLTAPQAAVSDSSGNLYFNEYGSGTGDGTPTALGTLWKLPAGSSTKIQLWQGSRLRGLAWVPGTQERLVQLTEANRDDQGNSSTTAIISTNGSLLATIVGLDYPQFTGVTASGNVVTTSPRDRALLTLLPEAGFGSDEPVALRTGVDCFATVSGTVHRIDGTGRSAVTLTGLAGGSLTFYVTPGEGGNFAGWVRMVKAEWPAVSTAELEGAAGKPGFYEVPQPGIQTSGLVERLQVVAHRSRNISRWPMTNVGTVNESPQAGFSEIPDGYLVYVEVSGLSATPVVNPVAVWDGGGGTNYAWSTPANWSGDILPGAGDDVVLKGIVQVNTPAGPVGHALAGDATNNVSLNLIAPGSLAARSLTVGGANNPSSYPNYFYGNGGSITTTDDLVVGANGARIEGVYTWGNISVGGALRIGSGYTASDSSWILRGASGAINSGSLVIGGGVQMVMDFIGGNSMRTLTVVNGVTLEGGSRLKVVGNANTGVGNNVRLINGGSNQLDGTFTSVVFEGFPANTLPRIEYNAVDGDVWLVVDGITPPTPFDEWSDTTNSAPDASTLPSYAVGGAVRLNAPGQGSEFGTDGSKLYLSAIIRTNDPNLTITGQSAFSLSGPWSDLAVNPQGLPSANTTNVPEGCERRIFSVDRGANAKLFLRLMISWQ